MGDSETPVVNIHNEWDPLEEIIVGTLEGMVIPPWEPAHLGPMYEPHFPIFKNQGGKQWPLDEVKAADRDLEELVHVLEAEGVKVRRPTAIDFTRPYESPHWKIPSGLGCNNPRDLLLVIGDTIIETAGAWRSRYFETFAYRSLLKEYWGKGANWVSAPKPELKDELFVQDFVQPKEGEPPRYVITEEEPVFDAADFMKCGRDIFVGLSSTCNKAGIEWVRRFLRSRHGDTYRVHQLVFNDQHPMHIDATFIPVGPRKLIVHPTRVTEIPPMFTKDWQILRAPLPEIPDHHPLYFSSKWMQLNVLMLDEERVICTKGENRMIQALKNMGLKPIPVNFWNFNNFGGGIHCATLDVRRRGTLHDYFA